MAEKKQHGFPDTLRQSWKTIINEAAPSISSKPLLYKRNGCILIQGKGYSLFQILYMWSSEHQPLVYAHVGVYTQREM